MPLTFDPPKAAKTLAAEALALHRESPLDGTYGIGVAEALIGAVSLDVVEKVYRFLTTNNTAMVRESMFQKTEKDSAAIRSWALHGGEAARLWSEKIHADAVDKKLVEEDPQTELFKLTTEELYDRFALEAWRYEYGFTPESVAKFIESYTTITGNLVDLPSAFGVAAPAVGNAIYRRYHAPDPFKLAMKLLSEGAPELRVAALMDVRDMQGGTLSESLEWVKLKSASPQAAAKQVWAPFVAYFVLAAEAPDTLLVVNEPSLKPPALDADKLPASPHFNDAINTALMYFHPLGARYVNPTGTKFDGITEEVFGLLTKAYFGHTVNSTLARKMLGKARRWTAENKLAGSLFHVFNAAWAKGDWQTILDSIPTGSDVHEPFSKFAAKNVLPVEGVKLQKTMSDSATIAALKKDGGDNLSPASIDGLQSLKYAAAAGTPYGIWSQFETAGKTKLVYLGYWVRDLGAAGKLHLHYFRLPGGVLVSKSEYELHADLKTGDLKVTHGHYEQPGTLYGKPPELEVAAGLPINQASVVAAPNTGIPSSIMAHLGEKYEADFLKAFIPFDPELTQTMAKAHSLLPSSKPYDHYLFKGSTKKFSLQHAFRVQTTTKEDQDGQEVEVEVDDIILVFQDFDDESLISESDTDVVGMLAKGALKVALIAMVPSKVQATPVVGSLVTVLPKFDVDFGLPPVSKLKHIVVGLSEDGKGVYLIPRALRDYGSTLIQAVPFTGITGFDPQPISVADWCADVTTFYAPFPFVQAQPKFPLGTSVNVSGKSGWIVGAFTVPNAGTKALISTGADAPGQAGLVFVAEGVLAVASAAPVATTEDIPAPASAPKPYKDDSAPWATPSAAKAAIEMGWDVRSFDEFEAYVYRAGQSYNEITVIAGLLRKPTGELLYAMQDTESGSVSFKAVGSLIAPTVEGNPPVLSVIGSLQVYGGVCVSGKLDYRVPIAALQAAVEGGGLIVFTPTPNAPKDPPYFPGTLFHGLPGKLVGWSHGGAVLMNTLSDGVGVSLFVVPAKEIELLVQVSATPALIDEDEGVVFARGSALVKVYSDGAAFENGPFTDTHDYVDEPPYQEGNLRKVAGTVIVLPPGAVITGAKSQFSMKFPSVILVHPVGGFASTLTFPKGGVDKGESLTKAARRETWEETGLKVRLEGHLGDYKRSTSLARMYLATFLGGTPYNAGSETDAVVVRPLKKFDSILAGATGDEQDNVFLGYVNTLPWAKPLSPVDKRVLADTVRWLVKNGMPGYLPAAAAAGVGTVKVQTAGSGALFGMLDTPDAGGHDHFVTADGIKAWKAHGLSFSDMATKYQSLVSSGFPAPGTLAHFGGLDDPAIPGGSVCGMVLGYNMVGAIYVQQASDGKLVTVHPKKSLTGMTVTVIPTVIIDFDTAKQLNVAHALHSLFAQAPYPVPPSALPLIPYGAIWEVVKKDPKEQITLASTATASGVGLMYGTGVLVPNVGAYVYLGTVRCGSVKVNLFTDMHTGVMRTLTDEELAVSSPLPPEDEDNVPALHPSDWAILAQTAQSMGPGQKFTASMGQARGVLAKLGVPYAHSLPLSKLPFAAWLQLKSHHSILDTVLLQTALDTVAKGAPVAQAVLKPGSMGGIAAPGKQKTNPALSHPVNVATPDVVQPIPTVVVEWDSPARFSDMQSLTESMLKNTGKKLSGGSKPNLVLQGPDGAQYVFKPSVENPLHFRTGAEAAAFTIINHLRPGKTPPVRRASFAGDVGSLQPQVMGAQTLTQGDYESLSDNDKGEILAQHAVDMFLGDHDGGVSNWLRAPDGRLVVIDKGQAFRFMLSGGGESLDPGTTPTGVIGKAISKRLLSDWAALSREIPKSAFARFAKSILAVSSLNVAVLDSALDVWQEACGAGAAKLRPKLREALIQRRDTYVIEWTKIMVMLAKARNESWKWPVPMVGAPDDTQLEQVPVGKLPPEEALEFTEVESKYIDDALKSGWQGKALQIDSDAIENQEVMVKAVDYKSGGKVTPGTLITFRVTYETSKAIEARFAAVVKVVSGKTGPAPLVVDTFYESIVNAAKTINHHLSAVDKSGGVKEADTNFNASKIEAYKSMLPKLKELVSATASGVGKYSNIPTGIVQAMAKEYLSYIESIEAVLANPTPHLGKTKVLDDFIQFKFQPKEAEEVDETLQDLTVTQQGSFSVPASTTAGTRVVVTDAVVSAPSGEGSKQYVIRLKSMPSVTLYMCPSGSMSAGVRVYFGLVWAVLPEAPSAATVARILRVFEKATDVRMNPASPEDREYLFLRKQMYITTPERISVSAEAVPKLGAQVDAAVGLFQQGSKEDALVKLRSALANRLGVTVKELLADPRYNAAPSYTRGAGYFRTLRMDYTAKSIRDLLGPDVYIAHACTGGGTLNIFQKSIPHNGALLANQIRPFTGIPMTGVSLGADLASGGATGVFMGMRKLGKKHASHLYFHIDLVLRADVYVVGPGDAYGKWTEARYSDPKKWVDAGLNQKTESVGASSHWQFVARHDVDFREYLAFAVFSSETERQDAIALCKQHGISTFAGKPLEQVLVTQ
jgi:8-oxo-dGTP pyrophosphatase MutT (NUDIX family)